MLAALVIFVLAAELVVASAILRMNYIHTTDQANHNLTVGTRVLDRLMAMRNDQLLSTVSILTADFGFKSAVATGDAATLQTSLANFSSRVHADSALLVSPRGKPMASVPANLARKADLPIAELITSARRSGSGSGLVMLGDQPIQFVVVPVRAPRLIAWAGMGFVIDDHLAALLSDLTGLDVTFVVEQRGQTVFEASSNPSRAVSALDGQYTRRQILLDTGARHLAVVLSLNHAMVMSGYYELARRLALIFGVTLAGSALLALWLSRRLSAPVAQMGDFARAVASGSYSSAPPSHGIGELDQLAVALSDMRDAVRERESRIRHQATHDALTGLPNRGEARKAIDHLLASGTPFGVVRLSIRGFQRINSALGYQLGDRTLQTVAERLLLETSDLQKIARTEGNDFLLITPDIITRSGLLNRLTAVRRSLEKPMRLSGTVLNLEFDIGVLISPDNAVDTETVWRRSTIARDLSARRRGSIVFYVDGMDERQFRELSIIRDLPRAVARDELALVYQPKLTLATGEVTQVEALVRWHHATLGFVPPDEFIGLAERSGQIHALTRWVAQTAAAQLDNWRRQGKALGLSLNLSADEIADSGLAATVAPVIEAAHRARDITLEVTESAILRDPRAAQANLRRLQARGARISMDDFGTGYSSFSQLKQLGANELKIDKSLVLDIDHSISDQHIVDAIIGLGHQLGLEVVAEGVETEIAWRFLARQNADTIQGFYLARPMNSASLDRWLRDHDKVVGQWASAGSGGNGSTPRPCNTPGGRS